MTRSILRNLAIAYGVYIASWWVAAPLALVYGKLTHGIHYRGEVSGTVLLPVVMTVPYAQVAFGVGLCVVWLVDSPHPFRWILFPALFYIFFGTIGYHWERPPLLLDRVAQMVDAALMVIGCLGGIIAYPAENWTRPTVTPDKSARDLRSNLRGVTSVGGPAHVLHG